MTDAEKKELEALKGKADLTDDEKARLSALEAKEAADQAAGDAGAGSDKTYDEAYVAKLRKENAKYRTKAKDLNTQLAGFDGIDPKKYQEFLDKEVKSAEDKLKKEGEFDKLREKLVIDHGKAVDVKDVEIANLNLKIESLEKGLNDIILSHEIAVQASVAGAINPQLVEMVVKTMAHAEKDEDGKRVIKVLDTDGTEKLDGKTGKPYTIAQALADLKISDQYAHLFTGGKQGAGSGTVLHDGKRVDNPWKKDTFNLTLQGKISQESPELAKRLKAEAAAG